MRFCVVSTPSAAINRRPCSAWLICVRYCRVFVPAGTVYAALGLGVLNKFLEGWTGAVLAKIAVLVFIIVFIQKRPQGLFAMKGRSAEA